MSEWMEVLRALEPNIDALTIKMLQGPKIIPQIVKRENAFELMFVDDSEIFNDYDDKLNMVIDWTNTHLHNSMHCKRQGFNSWYFGSRLELDKFITLYTLRWAS